MKREEPGRLLKEQPCITLFNVLDLRSVSGDPDMYKRVWIYLSQLKSAIYGAPNRAVLSR